MKQSELIANLWILKGFVLAKDNDEAISGLELDTWFDQLSKLIKKHVSD